MSCKDSCANSWTAAGSENESSSLDASSKKNRSRMSELWCSYEEIDYGRSIRKCTPDQCDETHSIYSWDNRSRISDGICQGLNSNVNVQSINSFECNESISIENTTPRDVVERELERNDGSLGMCIASNIHENTENSMVERVVEVASLTSKQSSENVDGSANNLENSTLHSRYSTERRERIKLDHESFSEHSQKELTVENQCYYSDRLHQDFSNAEDISGNESETFSESSSNDSLNNKHKSYNDTGLSDCKLDFKKSTSPAKFFDNDSYNSNRSEFDDRSPRNNNIKSWKEEEKNLDIKGAGSESSTARIPLENHSISFDTVLSLGSNKKGQSSSVDQYYNVEGNESSDESEILVLKDGKRDKYYEKNSYKNHHRKRYDWDEQSKESGFDHDRSIIEPRKEDHSLSGDCSITSNKSLGFCVDAKRDSISIIEDYDTKDESYNGRTTSAPYHIEEEINDDDNILISRRLNTKLEKDEKLRFSGRTCFLDEDHKEDVIFAEQKNETRMKSIVGFRCKQDLINTDLDDGINFTNESIENNEENDDIKREREAFLCDSDNLNDERDDVLEHQLKRSGRDVHFSENNRSFSTKERKNLPESIFSFLISSKPYGLSYLAAIFLILFKLAIFVILIVNLTATNSASSEQNPLGVAISFSWHIAICQIIFLIISVLTQDDLIKGLTFLQIENLSNALPVHPREAASNIAYDSTMEFSKQNWLIATCWKLFSGLVTLSCTFFFIITSSDVSSLFSFFVVIIFISHLDTTFFSLAKNDFLGKELSTEARAVIHTTYQVSSTKKANVLTYVLIFIVLVISSSWLYIILQQMSGSYWPQAIMLQIDDTNNVEYGFLSGLYVFNSNQLSYNKGMSRIMVCKAKNLWTISLVGENPCDDIILMSPVLKKADMDITTTIDQGWLTGTKLFTKESNLQIKNIFLSKACSSDEDCGGAQRGVCKKFGCNCTGEFYGLRCDFQRKKTCPLIMIDEQTPPFRSTHMLPKEYKVLRDDQGNIIQAYYHPIFIGGSTKQGIYVMLYSGLRWIIFSAGDIVGREGTENKLTAFFTQSHFDATQSVKNIYQVSNPIRFTSTFDDTGPYDVSWAPDTASFITGDSIKTRVICTECDEIQNKCLNGGVCIDGKCNCTNRAKGSLCQIVPVADGRCDHFFNNPLYGFDGGDCCLSTCVSSNVGTCGTASLRNQAGLSYIGFPFCRDPSVGRCRDTEMCSFSRGKDILLLSEGNRSSLLLSANGRIAVVGEPTLDAIRIFDLLGEKWVLRGKSLSFDRPVNFGADIAIATPPGNIFSRLFGRIPITLAASMKNSKSSAVRLYQWGSQDLEWLQVCKDITLDNCAERGCSIHSMSLGRGKDRGVLAIALENNEVYVYDLILNTSLCSLQWITKGTDAIISGNGNRLAVAMKNSIVSGTSKSDALAIFDVSNSHYHTTALDLDYKVDNLISSKYDHAFNEAIEDIQLALNYDGSILTVAMKSQDSVLIIDTISQSGKNSMYQSKDVTKINIGIDKSSLSGIKSKNISMRFSRDGASLGIKEEDNSILVIRQSSYNPPFWESNLRRFNSSSDIADFSVSGNGILITETQNSLIEMIDISRTCAEKESLFLISLKLDDNPGDITWYLDQVEVIEGLDFLSRTWIGCKKCYDQMFAGTVVVEEICIPDDVLKCMRFSFQSDRVRSRDTVTAFLNGDNLISYDGTAGDHEFILQTNGISTAYCEANEVTNAVSNDCRRKDEKLFLALVNTGSNPQEMEWKLEAFRGEKLLSGGPYLIEHETITYNICISLESECLLFTMKYKNQDEVNCKFGCGHFSLFLQDDNDRDYTKIHNPNGRFFGDEQHVLFGKNCPVQFIPFSTPTQLPSTSTSEATMSPILIPTLKPTLLTLKPNEKSISLQPSRAASLNPTLSRIPSKDLTLNPSQTFEQSESPSKLISQSASQAPVQIPSKLTYPTKGFRPSLFSDLFSSNLPTKINMVILDISISLDDRPDETGWVLSKNTGEQEIVEEKGAGSYSTSQGKAQESFTIEVGKSYLFCLFDTGGDGIHAGRFSVSYKGWPIILDNGNFSYEKCHSLGVSEEDLEDILRDSD